jgi:hypothetical protein
MGPVYQSCQLARSLAFRQGWQSQALTFCPLALAIGHVTRLSAEKSELWQSSHLGVVRVNRSIWCSACGIIAAAA